MATYRSVSQDIYKPDINPADRNRMALEAGYTGYEDFLANANKERQGGGGTNASIGTAPAATGISGGLTFQQPSINLPELYGSLTQKSGIGDVEKRLISEEAAYNEAQRKINDNPFLSEATRVGRVQKLSTDFQNRTANIRNELATKKADVETQLNLQTKQFDINSQQATQAFNQFQSLLSSGALDNAGPDDIANITRATGISSGMVQSAINAAKASKVQDVKTEMIKYDDGTNQGYLIVNSKTGDIIKKDTIAPSEPKKSTGGGSNTTQTKSDEQADIQYLLALYKNVNKSNPSWQKAHDLRNQYSPKDFKSMLLQTYPSQAAYINANLK